MVLRWDRFLSGTLSSKRLICIVDPDLERRHGSAAARGPIPSLRKPKSDMAGPGGVPSEAEVYVSAMIGEGPRLIII